MNTVEDNRLYVKVVVGKHQTTALIDPGSVFSYINEETARICRNNNWKEKPSRRIAFLADGTKTVLISSLTGPIYTMGKTFEQQFYVMKHLDLDILLGMNALKKLEIEIRLNGHLIKNPNNGTSMGSIENQTELSHLRESEKTETFLKTEMKKSEEIKGITPFNQRKGQLEDPTLIKQNYKPGNPATPRQTRDIKIDDVLLKVPIGMARFRIRVGRFKYALRLDAASGDLRHWSRRQLE